MSNATTWEVKILYTDKQRNEQLRFDSYQEASRRYQDSIRAEGVMYCELCKDGHLQAKWQPGGFRPQGY
jgi:hypothetical protein